ncbi:MAG: hypothetical protein ACYCSF_07920 [Acidimicrobiales bacterium]
MRKVWFTCIVAALAVVAVPATAFAAQGARKTPTVAYVLRGTLSSYTAATSTSNGSVSIAVSHANLDNKTLSGQTMTFSLSPKTKIVLHDGKAVADGNNGIVNVRAPRNADATTIQSETPFAVIDQGASHAKSGQAPKAVMYVLSGTLSSYTAATSTSNGSVTIAVSHANLENKTLKGQTMTFSLSPKTKIVLHDGKAVADGDNGIVKVRAPKNADTTTLQSETPFQLIDQGATS